MKTFRYSIFALLLLFTGCRDYLTEIEPGTTLLGDFFTSTAAAEQNITGCYVPLMWEYNNTYLSEWFIGDIVSDDALKGGGSTTDMADAYDMENWRTTSQNTLLLDFYRAQYQGIGRCNLAIKYVSNMEIGTDSIFTPTMKNRLLGEAHFLRAYYYFRLMRVFAGVPITTDVIDDSDRWGLDRSSVEQVYALILDDLTKANYMLPVRSAMKAEDLGRATKGAAQAMLLKVNLYMASPYWNKQLSQAPATYFAAAKQWGDSIIFSGEYSLCPNYEDNFTLAGENGQESVFEIQYTEVPWGDYGDGNDPSKFGYTAGSFTQILMRSRSSLIGGGWGFDHPTQNLYDEFEPTDIRRDVAILNPVDSLIETPSVEIYLGSRYLNNKYGMYRDPADQGGGYGKWSLHASRGPLNNRQIRYADVLLMLAEAKAMADGGSTSDATAVDAYWQVRSRAVGASENKPSSISFETVYKERMWELCFENQIFYDQLRTRKAFDTDRGQVVDLIGFHSPAHDEGVKWAEDDLLMPYPIREKRLNPNLVR